MRSLLCSLVLLTSVFAQVTSAGEYRDDELGFAFTTPSLGAPPANQAVQRIVISGPQIDNFAPTVKVQVKQIQTTLEKMVEQSDKDFAANMMTVTAKTPRDVAGLPAVSYECEWTYNMVPMKMINLVVIEPTRMVILTCACRQTEFPSYEAEFRKAVDSFVVRR